MRYTKRPGSSQLTQTIAKAIAELSDRTYKNIYQVAKANRLSSAMLSRRIHGGLSQHEANVQNQALTPAEESALVTFIKHITALGHSIRHVFLRELAEVLHKN